MIRITCYNNDPDCGDVRTLAKFENGNTALDQEPALSKAISWLDDMLEAVTSFSLVSALNAIQAECNLDKDPEPFPNKYAMPLCIVNLVLKEYGLELEKADD